MARWLLVFFLTPILEMYLLIEVGGYLGTLPTIGLVMLTAVIGVALLRRQGLATLTRGLGRLQRGEIPAQEMAEGILLGIAGALLITPGFVTDAVGFAFLLPVSRVLIARKLLAKITIIGPQGAAGAGPTIIEGDFDHRPDSTGGSEQNS
ncbi:MAG: FxsA family protein [Gammaproteobacteria bacterium]|nr:FxsA family protein [Gammaproteobacteria bacterium]